MKSLHETVLVTTLRMKCIGILRIIFGVLFAVDATMKWLPGFLNQFGGFLKSALDGQPHAVVAWITFWIGIVNADPHLFGILTAVFESFIAVALILGVFSNLAYLGGSIFMVIIWTTAEGFGGPYAAGASDIGAAIIYSFVLVAFFFVQAGMYYGLDKRLTPLLGRWGFLASGPLPSNEKA